MNGPPAFTPIIMEEIGKAVCVSILDLAEKNEYSRLHVSPYRNLTGLKLEVAEILATK